MSTVDSFGAKGVLNVGGTEYEIFRLNSVEGAESLPFSLKVLLENLLRTEDGANITADHIRALAGWDENAQPSTEIQFTPARVIMQRPALDRLKHQPPRKRLGGNRTGRQQRKNDQQGGQISHRRDATDAAAPRKFARNKKPSPR